MDSTRQYPRTTTVRLPPAERRLVEAAALVRGIGPSTYLRMAALEAARRDIARAALDDPPPETEQ